MSVKQHQADVKGWAERKGWFSDLSKPAPEVSETSADYQLAVIALHHCLLSDLAEYIRQHGKPPPSDDRMFQLHDRRAARFELLLAQGPSRDIVGILSKLALLHTEVTEAVDATLEDNPLEYAVDGKPEGLMSELADVYIRTLNLTGNIGGDLESAYESKMDYNEGRPFKHGGKLA